MDKVVIIGPESTGKSTLTQVFGCSVLGALGGRSLPEEYLLQSS